MSTIVSVALMVGSLYFTGEKTALISLSVLAFLFGSYLVWAKTDGALTLEKQKNELPRLVGEVLEVQSKIIPTSWCGEKGVFVADYFVFVRLRVCNHNPAETTVSKFTIQLEDERHVSVSSESIPTENARRNELHTEKLQSDRKLEDLAVLLKEPLKRGVEREGWLEFLVKAIPGEKNGEGKYPPETRGCRITLTDAFGGNWEIKGRAKESTVSIHMLSQ